MARSRIGLKLLGLCALIMGVMAIGGAGLAQAEPGSYWGYLNGAELIKFGVALEPELGFEIEELGGAEPGRHLVLLFRIAGSNVAILCTELTSDLKLKAEGLVLGLLTLHGCATRINGIPAPACIPHSPGAKAGLIKSLELDGLIELHKLEPSGVRDDIVKFIPDVGSNAIAHIQFGEECSLPEEILIFGYFSVYDCQNEFLVHKVTHLWQEFAPLTHLYVISDTLEHKVTIDGSVNVFLKGKHLGLKWAGTPA
jgi:hypothetical protein